MGEQAWGAGMSVWVTVLLFLVGLVLIIKGGDWFLSGAVWIAEATGVPRFIIGATIVSVATTLPELTVSVTGVLQNEVDMAVGNAVGSVTANLGLILGISVVCIPSVVHKQQFRLKALLMAASALLLFLLCRGGRLTVGPSLCLVAVFTVYLVSNLTDARTSMAENRTESGRGRSVSRRQLAGKLTAFVVGIAAIVMGSPDADLLWKQDCDFIGSARWDHRGDYGGDRNLPARIGDDFDRHFQAGGVHVCWKHHRGQCD